MLRILSLKILKSVHFRRVIQNINRETFLETLCIVSQSKIGLQYAAKGRELTQLHNGVARGNGLILYVHSCLHPSVSVKFSLTQRYRH